MGKGKYACPPDAGPAWREAYEAGCDMEELEATLQLTPEQRLAKHQKKLDAFLEFEAFLNNLQHGWNLIQSYHGHTR